MAETTDLRIDVQEPASWSRKLSITVPGERVRRTRQSVTARIAGNLRLPGFRKGKIPPSVVERQFGPAIEQELLDRVIQDAYREALDARDFRPITQGEVENVQYPGGDAELTFDVQFEVRPELTLARTEGFDLVRPSEEVAETEVDRLLEQVRSDRATLEPMAEDAKPAYGDLVVVRITDLDVGEEGEGEPQSFRFELGEGQAIPDIEQAIMTLSPGEEAEFTVTFPADFADPAQAGKEQRLRIRLDEGRHKRLPELDDALAKELGDFEDLAALRARIRADMEREAHIRADAALRDQLVQRIVEANPFEVPASMVERYLDFHLGDTPDEHGRKRQRTAEEQERISQLRGIMRPQAEASLKRMMVVEHVSEVEGLRATSDDVDTRVEALAEEHGRSPSEVWVELERSGQMQALESEILEEKVFGHLLARSTVTQG